MEKELIIISVGGSLIVPEDIDVAFLRKLKTLVLGYLRRGKSFIIISGGGKTCRKYQKAAGSVTRLTDEDLDWLGIHSTRLNAHLIRTIFREHAHPRIIKDPNEKVNFREKVLVAAGWKPGCSTDWDAVMLAKTMGVRRVVNLTNVDYVCDKDPKYHKDAKIIKEMRWKDFMKLLPDKWDPGLNSPFDPVASREAAKLGIEVAIINGKKLAELDRYIKGKPFKGTRIYP